MVWQREGRRGTLYGRSEGVEDTGERRKGEKERAVKGGRQRVIRGGLNSWLARRRRVISASLSPAILKMEGRAVGSLNC